MGNPRFVSFEALLESAHDRTLRCTRCGNSSSAHGERTQDSPPGCGWTYSMVLIAAYRNGIRQTLAGGR